MHQDNRILRQLRARLGLLRKKRPGADPWLVLEGDWGGQIYLTVPWRLVGSGARIRTLLVKLDRLVWACNDGKGTRAVLVDRRESDKQDGRYIVLGGMGGGVLEDGIWIHEVFREHWISLRARKLLNLRG